MIVHMNMIIIANWKLNPESFKDASKFLNLVKHFAGKMRNVTTIIAPPTLFLRELSSGNRSKKFLFSAQDMHQSNFGSEVGEISPTQLVDAKVPYVLIGHSARRASGESNEQIKEKVFAAVKNNLKAVIFVGEKKRDDDGKFLEYIRYQIKSALEGIPPAKLKDLILVYEPVWAISSNRDKMSSVAAEPTSHEIYQMALFLKKVVSEVFDLNAMKKVKILYGGSVNEENAKEILEIPNISGVVVGSASLDSDKFEEILTIANSISK